MTVRLRPHHLLCLLTYAGKGYSPAFVVHYDEISKRLSDGEDILIVEGPDDICAPLLGDDAPHCFRQSVRDRDARAAHDVGRLIGLQLSAGTQIQASSALVERMRAAFSDGQTRSACGGCEWSDLCSSIADAGYRMARIHPPASAPEPTGELLL